jgi:branched-chain amino acid transport system substrate-binding protein
MWKDRLKWSLVLVLAVAMAATMMLSGCTSDEGDEDDGDEDAAATETLKIGVHTSLTGGLADYGAAAEGGLRIANEDYGTVEIDGTTYEIELIVLDDKGEPAEASVVAQNLVDEGVVGVVGALTSGNTNAALPIYQDAGIPVISGSATNPDLTNGDFENFLRTCLRDDLQGAAIAEWASENGYAKVAVMDDRGDYAVGLADIVEANLADLGIESQREQGQEGDTDFSAQVANIGAFAPDAVIFTGYHREAGLLFKQLTEAGVETQFMGGDGIKSDEIGDEAGGAENVEGALATFGGFAPDEMPGFEEFATRFEEAEGVAAGPYAENNHDGYVALVMAMEEAQSLDGADILEALHTMEFEGVQGMLSFDEMGDVTTPGASGTELIPRFEYQGGTWVFISE